MKNIAIIIIKAEGVNGRWNQKFYQPGESIVIYVNNEKIDVTEAVASVRDSKGMLSSGRIIDVYNEMILVNMYGNIGLRAARYINSGRKIPKQHQNVLVFYKGDPKKIKQNYPELDLSDIELFEDENI